MAGSIRILRALAYLSRHAYQSVRTLHPYAGDQSPGL
jgi:hypothetical protein